jgi:MFS family permease
MFGGRRKPFVYLSCAILGAVTFAMIFANSLHGMVILCLVFGAGNGMYLTMETSLAIDTLPDHYEDGPSGGHAQLLGSKFSGKGIVPVVKIAFAFLTNVSSCLYRITTVWGVAAFLGSALGPMIGGPLLYLFGKNPVDEEQTYSLPGAFVDDII